jgi:hypothetical protein
MNRWKTAAKIVLAMLREIFDETPYQRFLQRTGLPSSPAAYQQFCRERESAYACRPRCC